MKMPRLISRGSWRRVNYATDLASLPVGTLLTFPHSHMAAVRLGSGWRLTGKVGDQTDSVIRNLPAEIERIGPRVADGDDQ